ncbi:MAG: DUF2207 domain-containing protein, partial [Thaumarchaeota archaeon]|nr:DUF2207 domain-containing protein [Nitrososphaerota archaeon]
LEPKDRELSIRILSEGGEDLDVYEKRVLKFLRKLSRGDVLDTADLEKSLETELADEARWVIRNPTSKPALSLMTSGRRRLAPFSVFAAVLLFATIFSAQFMPEFALMIEKSVAYSVIFLVESIVAVIAPSTLFGKWKGSAYKEKLEWDAFRKFLSDLALIRKYAPQDLSIWGEWLVYGTALGVGDKVAEAMEALGVTLEEAAAARNMPKAFAPIITAISPKSEGGSGGGFGAGGGFGGGGAGAR